MDLQCPSCNHKATSLDLPHLDGGVITCRNCGEEYHIQGNVIDPEDRFHKQIWELPRGLQIFDQGDQVHIHLKSKGGRWLTFGVALFFEIIILIFLSQIWANLNHHPITYIILGSIALGPILLMGSAFRRSVLTMGKGTISVGYTIPRLFFSTKEFRPGTFKQFFVEEHVRNRSGHAPSITYSVNGQPKGNADAVRLLQGIQTPAEAYYIEQELEAFYRLEDVAHEGEYDSRRKLRLDAKEGFSMAKQVFQNSKAEYSAKSKEERQAEIMDTPVKNYVLGLLILGAVSALMLSVAMDEGGFFPWLFGCGFGVMAVATFGTLIKRVMLGLKG